MSLKFHEMTIDAYLSALGSTAPAPGGGAAAGLIGAQACALGEMVSRLSSSERILMISVKKQSSMPPFSNQPALFSLI